MVTHSSWVKNPSRCHPLDIIAQIMDDSFRNHKSNDILAHRMLRIVFVIFRLCTHQQRVELNSCVRKKDRGLMVGQRKGKTDDIQRKSQEEMR